MNNWQDLFRVPVRPLVTVGLVGALIAIVIKLFWNAKVPPLPAEVYVAIISSFITTVSLVIAFWFGARSTRPPGS